MKLPQLKSIAKENKIGGRSIMNKSELIAILEEKNLLSEDPPPKVAKCENTEDARYAYLKSIRRNPRCVRVEDVKSGQIMEYPSLYKAGRALSIDPSRVLFYDGRIIDNTYKINTIN